MTTKESLQKAQESVNLALFKLKQSYSSSPSSHIIFFIVEGKDDIPYYATKVDDLIPRDWKLVVIPANNRKKVIQVYQEIDWTTYNKHRIFFFIDRDLSDYTGEYTPIDFNIYLTSRYAIENELCTFDTFIKTLKYYYDLNDINEIDEAVIEKFYNDCWECFCSLSDPIMAQILFWKTNSITSNYNNFKIQNVFEIKNNILQRNHTFSSDEELIKELCKQSGVNYTSIDIPKYISLLNSKHTTEEYIRGKYVLAFFVKSLTYISKNSTTLLPSKKNARDTLGLGYENVISKLCGIMKTPESLRIFFSNIINHLC